MFWVPPWPTGKRETRTHRSRFFCTGTRPRRTYGGISFPWLHRQRIASHRISSGSANRENQTSSIGLPITFGTSMRSSLTLELVSIRHSARLGNRAGISPGSPQAGVYPWACFYGVPPTIAYLGGFSCDCTRNLPEGQDARSGRKDDSRRQCIRGGSSSLGDRTKADG